MLISPKLSILTLTFTDLKDKLSKLILANLPAVKVLKSI
jgi:hypothetical protein